MCNDAYHVSGATRWMQSVMQTRVKKNRDCVLLMAACCLPRHLYVFVCMVLVLSSGLSGSLGLAVFVLSSLFSSPPSLPPSSLAFCQSSQDFRWNDAVTKRARQRLPGMPSQVFVFRGPPLPPPPPPPLLPPPPDPWEQEVYLVKWWMGPLLLLRGKGEKNLSFPPGQSDEFSSLKAEGRLCFLGAPWNPWSLSAWKPRALLYYVCGEN